ncbi:TMV resistance protein N-like [Bidens hawaiensis]|uniref:TMV resistance protein N-like n=1 Tax=Bidens hawaiensis TaxID=980011 RepID=UPI004049A3A4
MKGLRKMKELRSLYVNVGYTKDAEGSQYLPDVLRSLRWLEYPFQSLPETFQANNLVNFEMRGSNISKVWEGGKGKVLNKLKFLDLSYSNLRTFDLSETPHLEELNLEGCVEFSELHMPVKCPNLKVLHLSHSKVRNLNLGLTPHLEELYLVGCFCLQKIHATVGCLKNLVDIQLKHCLNVAYFRVDKEHESASLETVATIFEIDVGCVDVCPLHPKNNLPRFWFRCKYDEPRSSWSGNLEKLISFGPCVCENIEYILATICGLQHLRNLELGGGIPWDMGQLESLEKPFLSGQRFQHLPDSIYMLKNLKSLKLGYCFALKQLPENICELERLEDLIIWDCKSLRDIPNNLCKMKCLKRLEPYNCPNIKKLPEELGSLECLKELRIEDTDINRLPRSIYQLKGLRIYGSTKQLESYGFTSILADEILK